MATSCILLFCLGQLRLFHCSCRSLSYSDYVPARKVAANPPHVSFSTNNFSVLQWAGPVMDMESIPEPVWQEAEKRAAALRPLSRTIPEKNRPSQ